MSDDAARPTDKKTFTYDEALALMPEVKRLTQAAWDALEAVRESAPSSREAQSRSDEILGGWARALMAHGIEVKGLWLVDFDNGSGYYCWKHPEPSLSYYHSYEEGFSGRMRIQ